MPWIMSRNMRRKREGRSEVRNRRMTSSPEPSPLLLPSSATVLHPYTGIHDNQLRRVFIKAKQFQPWFRLGPLLFPVPRNGRALGAQTRYSSNLPRRVAEFPRATQRPEDSVATKTLQNHKVLARWCGLIKSSARN
jgi:hypothetical protein